MYRTLLPLYARRLYPTVAYMASMHVTEILRKRMQYSTYRKSELKGNEDEKSQIDRSITDQTACAISKLLCVIFSLHLQDINQD